MRSACFRDRWRASSIGVEEVRGDEPAAAEDWLLGERAQDRELVVIALALAYRISLKRDPLAP